jgi:hypothetical protein
MRSKNPGGGFGSRLETVVVVDEQAKNTHEIVASENQLKVRTRHAMGRSALLFSNSMAY